MSGKYSLNELDNDDPRQPENRPSSPTYRKAAKPARLPEPLSSHREEVAVERDNKSLTDRAIGGMRVVFGFLFFAGCILAAIVLAYDASHAPAPQGAVLAGLACFAGIMARIFQADYHRASGR